MNDQIGNPPANVEDDTERQVRNQVAKLLRIEAFDQRFSPGTAEVLRGLAARVASSTRLEDLFVGESSDIDSDAVLRAESAEVEVAQLRSTLAETQRAWAAVVESADKAKRLAAQYLGDKVELEARAKKAEAEVARLRVENRKRAHAEFVYREAKLALHGVPSWTEEGQAKLAAYNDAKAELVALGGAVNPLATAANDLRLDLSQDMCRRVALRLRQLDHGLDARVPERNGSVLTRLGVELPDPVRVRLFIGLWCDEAVQLRPLPRRSLRPLRLAASALRLREDKALHRRLAATVPAGGLLR